MAYKKYKTIEEKRKSLRDNYKRWRDKNLEVARKRSIDWNRENYGFKGNTKLKQRPVPGICKDMVSYSRKYYIENRDRIIKNVEKYRKENVDKIRILKKVYKARRRASGRIRRGTLQIIYEDNIKINGTLTCGLCNSPINFGEDSLDHKIPVSRGGDNSYQNLWIVHSSCNSRKKDKTVEEYLKLKGDN